MAARALDRGTLPRCLVSHAANEDGSDEQRAGQDDRLRAGGERLDGITAAGGPCIAFHRARSSLVATILISWRSVTFSAGRSFTA